MNKFKQNTTMSSKLFEGTKTAKLVELIATSAATGSQEAKAIRIGGNEVIHGMEHLINPDVTHFIVLKQRCHIHSVLEEQQAQKSAEEDGAGKKEKKKSAEEDGAAAVGLRADGAAERERELERKLAELQVTS